MMAGDEERERSAQSKMEMRLDGLDESEPDECNLDDPHVEDCLVRRHPSLLHADEHHRSPLNHPLIEATLASDACLSPYGHPPSFGWQRKLVKLSKHDPDSDVWEADEWAESLELLLEEGLLPGMPQEGF